MNDEKHRIINENGEIIHSYNNGEWYLRNRKQDEAYRKKQDGRNTNFTFTKMDAIKEVIKVLNDAELGYLLLLQCFIDFDNRLVNSNRHKTPMTKKDVQETLGLGRTKFTSFWKTLLTLEIVEEKEGELFMDTKYHFKGTLSSDDKVIRSFTTKVKELYTTTSAKDLGFIYKLLPYVHYETNTLCNNPYEKNPMKIQKLSQVDIAEIVGIDARNVRRKLKRLTLGVEYVFAEISVGRTKQYMVNPFLFYRRQGKPNATLTTIFTIRKP